MGNREDLLVAAKRCLFEKGYARTTVRDIASMAGVSMAAIGYHFRSKEALLNAALVEASGDEIGEELARGAAAGPRDGTRLDRFEAMWRHMLASFAKHRQLLAASMENMAQAERVPEVRQVFQHAQVEAIEGIAEMLVAADPSLDERSSRVVAGLYYTLLSGLIVQWMIDPEHPPAAREMAEALVLLTRA